MNLSTRSILREACPRIIHDWLQAHRRGQSLGNWRRAQHFSLHLLPSLNLERNGLVLDLGANIGDWTDAVLSIAPSVQVIAVEPNEEPRKLLEDRFANDHRVVIDSHAVADVPGKRRFYLTTHNHNSSLHLPHGDMGRSYFGGWDVVQAVDIETTTVDDLSGGRPVSVLKIDVQGAEREVLTGAAETLRRTKVVLIEVTFVSHYKDDATFPSLHEHLSYEGFELAGLGEPFHSRRGTVLWCDACYTPINP